MRSLVDLWSEAAAWAYGEGADDLYQLLVPLTYRDHDLGQLDAASWMAARKPGKTTDLRKVIEAVTELRRLEEMETRLSLLPRQRRPRPSTLLGQATQVSREWLQRDSYDYARAEANAEFRERKRAAVEKLVAALPLADREVVALEAEVEPPAAAPRVETPAAPAPSSDNIGGSVADRLATVLLRLTREGKFNATQGEVADMAGCSDRQLRPGRSGRKAWNSYVAAGRRRESATDTSKRRNGRTLGQQGEA